MIMEEFKIGLWSKQSKGGFNYYAGKVVINGEEYHIAMFDNRDKKKSEKSPDFNINMQKKKVEEQTQAVQQEADQYSDLPF